METSALTIHPLVAGASVAVITVSLLGAAALTGILPSSHAAAADPATPAYAARTEAMPALPQAVAAPVAAPEPKVVVKHERHYVYRTRYIDRPVYPATTGESMAYAPVGAYGPAAPAAYSTAAYAPVPVAPAPDVNRQYSPVGIGVGAVVGGLLGNQVGNGRGRTLATIAGALGGAFVGNNAAQRYNW